ncbi:MAG: hypothetical protein WC838_03310, partial [Candidatus Margulisiibacteriota bacterium]
MSQQDRDLSTPLQYLKGVGPKLAELFASRLELNTVKDLLFYFPRAYDDRRNIQTIKELKLGEVQMVLGKVVTLTDEKKGRLNILKAVLEQDGRYLTLVWFNQPFLKKLLHRAVPQLVPQDTEKQEEVQIFAKGKVDINSYTRELQMSVQEFELIDDVKDNLSLGRVVPIYGLTEGLFQKKIRSLAKSALDIYLEAVPEHFTEADLKKYEIEFIQQAVSDMHFPRGREEWKKAHDRLVFEEFFRFYLRLFSIRKDLQKAPGISFNMEDGLY